MAPRPLLHELDETLDSTTSRAIRGGVSSASGRLFDPANPESIWSESLQSVLEQPPSVLPRRLILGGLAFCCVLGTWAWFGKVQEVSHATGQLMPKGKVYQVQPVVQGEVVRILVKPGQQVKSGQLIAEVDSRLAEAEVDRLQQNLATDRLKLIQTQELLNRAALEIQIRRAIAAAQVHAQSASLAEAEADAATQKAILMQTQVDQTAFTARLERLKPLLEEGVIAREQVFEVEQGLRDRQRTSIQAEGELNRAQATANRFQAELARQQAEAKRSELETQQQMQQLKLEITALAANIEEGETLLKAAQTQLKQSFLYAPVDGTVFALHIDNVGEVTQPGETIAEIAPDNAPLILSAVLPDREAGLVQPGMNVQMKFDAFPYQEYGIVSGKVLSISPSTEVHEQLGAVYQVEISLSRDQITSEEKSVRLKAGQTASADIVVRQYRIMDVLLKPFQSLRQDNLTL